MGRPTKQELMQFVGKNVEVKLTDNWVEGTLGYTRDFSEEYNYRVPGYFTILEVDFKAKDVVNIHIK